MTENIDKTKWRRRENKNILKKSKKRTFIHINYAQIQMVGAFRFRKEEEEEK